MSTCNRQGHDESGTRNSIPESIRVLLAGNIRTLDLTYSPTTTRRPETRNPKTQTSNPKTQTPNTGPPGNASYTHALQRIIHASGTACIMRARAILSRQKMESVHIYAFQPLVFCLKKTIRPYLKIVQASTIGIDDVLFRNDIRHRRPPFSLGDSDPTLQITPGMTLLLGNEIF